MSADALTIQHDGTHYVKLAIQPVDFAQKNRWDFCLGSALKYLTRWRDKAGAVDLEKAKHFIQLRETVDERTVTCLVQPIAAITMEFYIEVNRITDMDATALLALDIYANKPTDTNREVFFRCVDRLLAIAS